MPITKARHICKGRQIKHVECIPGTPIITLSLVLRGTKKVSNKMLSIRDPIDLSENDLMENMEEIRLWLYRMHCLGESISVKSIFFFKASSLIWPKKQLPVQHWQEIRDTGRV